MLSNIRLRTALFLHNICVPNWQLHEPSNLKSKALKTKLAHSSHTVRKGVLPVLHVDFRLPQAGLFFPFSLTFFYPMFFVVSTISDEIFKNMGAIWWSTVISVS